MVIVRIVYGLSDNLYEFPVFANACARANGWHQMVLLLVSGSYGNEHGIHSTGFSGRSAFRSASA